MKFDVAIVGSGLAGLSVALHLAHTRQVVVISKRALRDGASDWAQGGAGGGVHGCCHCCHCRRGEGRMASMSAVTAVPAGPG